MTTMISKATPEFILTGDAQSFLDAGEIHHLIEGEFRRSVEGGTFPVFNPSTGKQIAVGSSCAPGDLEAAVTSARRSYEDGRWSRTTPKEKEAVLRRLAQLIEENATTLGDIDATDGGYLRRYADFTVAMAAGSAAYYSGWPTKMTGDTLPVGPDVSAMTLRVPIGVIGIIVPWNGGSAILGSVVAALSMGNSVIIKPAENTPMSAAKLGELALEAGVPPGVFNVLQGLGSVAGQGLTEHRGVDAIHFTGSVATGIRIQQTAARTMKRVSLELGGKAPFIIFDDADLDKAVAAATACVWGNAGQVCTAGTRTLVHRSIYDAYLERAVELSNDLTVGHAFAPETDMGPLISSTQLDAVHRYVDIGISEGASLVLGGGASGDAGYYHEPTIFAGVDNDMTIAREEIFGPIMSVIPFDDEDEAYRIANDSEFGLSAGVWTRDVSRSQRAQRAIKAGTVWINCYQKVDHAVPYGGVKMSGYGRNLGSDSLDNYTETKSVWTGVDL